MDNAPLGERSSRWLLDVLFEYIPEDILRMYNLELRKGMRTKSPTPASLSEFLRMYLESAVDTREQKKTSVSVRKPKSGKPNASSKDWTSKSVQPLACDYCKGKHVVTNCSP